MNITLYYELNILPVKYDRSDLGESVQARYPLKRVMYAKIGVMYINKTNVF